MKGEWNARRIGEMNYGVFAPKNFDFQEGKELSLPGKFAPGNFWNFSSCEQKWNFHFLELLLSMQPAN